MRENWFYTPTKGISGLTLKPDTLEDQKITGKILEEKKSLPTGVNSVEKYDTNGFVPSIIVFYRPALITYDGVREFLGLTGSKG